MHSYLDILVISIESYLNPPTSQLCKITLNDVEGITIRTTHVLALAATSYNLNV